MRILVKGLSDERFHRPLVNIANLFEEDSEVLFDSGEANDGLVMVFDWKETGGMVEASGHIAGSDMTSCFTREMPEGLNDKERWKQIKNTVLSVYLHLLQEYTGMTQKWGILTGIRPTKLLHKMLREGMTKEEAHAALKRDYLIHDEKINLMQEIVDRQIKAIPDLYDLQEEVSIYIGIPFCPTKC
ncbi:coproporphyrinogen III oxidase, partial [Bacillus altitudinis]|nr:coproporphyrinogen III oxidase [Bacillus altitudinis]